MQTEHDYMDCIWDALIICICIEAGYQRGNQRSQATNSEAQSRAAFEQYLDAIGFNDNHCARYQNYHSMCQKDKDVFQR